jgi:adenylate cyclase
MRYMNRHWPRMLVTLVSVVFALMHALGTLPMGLMHRLDGIFYDARLRATQEQSHDDRIAIVDIDEKSLAEIGRWPWSRNKLATLTDVLFDQQKIAILGFDVVFAEPDDSSGAGHLTDLVQQRTDLNAAMVTQLAEIRKELDYDAMFARTLQHRPVVLGYYFTSEATRRTSSVLPSPVIAQSSPVPAQATRAPWNGYGSNIPSLAQAAPLAGFFNSFTDPDGIVRSLPLIAFFDGKGYESLSLAIFRQLIKTPQVTGGFAPETPAGAVLQSVILHRGTQQFTIPVDDRAGLLVPYRGHGGVTGGSFTYVSASDVLSGRLPANSLKGKIVLVGSTAPGIVDLRATPMDAVYPGIEVHANVLSGLLDRRFLVKPDYAIGYEVVALLLAGVVLAAVLPALSALQACFMALLVGGGLIGLNLWLYLADGLVLPMASQVFVVAASFVLNMSYGYFIESRSKRELVQLFGTYVPPELVQEMMQDPGRYSMQARNEELTVMFCDMRGFTQLSEHMEPVALQQLLNRLFNELTTLIRASRGTVDKYMGDCVMAFWGAPVTTPNHASLAVGAALAMKQAIERINKEPGYSQMPTIGMGIGRGAVLQAAAATSRPASTIPKTWTRSCWRSVQDICKLLNADRLTVYAVNDDRTAIISKVKTGLNSSRDLKLPITPQSIAGYVAFSKQPVNLPMSMTMRHSSDSPDADLPEGSGQALWLPHQTDAGGAHPGRECLHGVLQVINNKSDQPFGELEVEGVPAVQDAGHRHSPAHAKPREGAARPPSTTAWWPMV